MKKYFLLMILCFFIYSYAFCSENKKYKDTGKYVLLTLKTNARIFEECNCYPDQVEVKVNFMVTGDGYFKLNDKKLILYSKKECLNSVKNEIIKFKNENPNKEYFGDGIFLFDIRFLCIPEQIALDSFEDEDKEYEIEAGYKGYNIYHDYWDNDDVCAYVPTSKESAKNCTIFSFDKLINKDVKKSDKLSKKMDKELFKMFNK